MAKRIIDSAIETHLINNEPFEYAHLIKFERPFHPEIGGNVRALLFENMTPLTALNLQRKIEEVLSNFEPRAKITQIIADPDMDRNGYRLEIRFYVIGIQNPITVETFLERLR